MSKQKQAVSHKEDTLSWAFNRENYKIMFIGLALLTLGYLLMIGGGSSNPTHFSPAIFDFQRLTLAPILVLAGYATELFAIMKRPKTQQ